MSRSPSLVLACTFMITPSGWALPTHANSMFGHFLAPMCDAWSDIEEQAERFGPEIDPRSTVWLLPAFQQLLGPDPCGRDQQALTLAGQQRLAYQRLTARGGQSIPYYLSVAASLGQTATIQEAAWRRFGPGMRFGKDGARFAPRANHFNWAVTLPQRVVTKFRFGTSQCGNSLGSFSASLVQCPITHAAPAHTVVTFNYSGTETQ